MKTNKSRGWVKKTLCAGTLLGLAASMGAPTALASGFEPFTPFSRIATLPVVIGSDGVTVDPVATYARVQEAALYLATYVANEEDSVGDGGDWVLGGTSEECRKREAACTAAEIKGAILGIPSPEPINPSLPVSKTNTKKASVLDFCNEYYAKQALGVAPISDGKKVVNGYSHTPALPCEVSIWNDDQHIYVDMLDPNGIFSLFFTDVHFSDDMLNDSKFATAISDLPPKVKDEIKTIVQRAMNEFAASKSVVAGNMDEAIGPEYTSMEQVIEAVDAAPYDSPYKHVGYTRANGADFIRNESHDDAKIVAQAIIETMSIHGETGSNGAGKHPTVINEKNGKTLDSILSPGSSWRSARHDPLPLPGKNFVIEACSPQYAKMAMGTGLHHVTALPCEITVQIIDRDGHGGKETLVVSYLDPHFMLGALFADISKKDKKAFSDIPGTIMDDLQKIVAAALEFESGYELNKPINIHYDMLPDEDNN